MFCGYELGGRGKAKFILNIANSTNMVTRYTFVSSTNPRNETLVVRRDGVNKTLTNDLVGEEFRVILDADMNMVRIKCKKCTPIKILPDY
jgi:hypothetical protein